MRAVLLLGLLSLSGCCALAQGLRTDVRFTSSPPGARVEFGDASGVTPCTLSVKRSRKPRMVTFQLEDMETVEEEVEATATEIGDAPWLLPLAIGDGLLVLPAIVDLALPVMYSWPEEIRATMKPTGSRVWVERGD